MKANWKPPPAGLSLLEFLFVTGAACRAAVVFDDHVRRKVLLTTLGSGSFTTIYKHLSAWEASRASAGTTQTSVIPDAVLSAFGAAWRAASAEAGKEVVTVREQAMEEVKAAQAQFQEALQMMFHQQQNLLRPKTT